MKSDPGLYDYLPYNNRPAIRWPNGARVAFWVAPNIEFYELHPQPRRYADILKRQFDRLYEEGASSGTVMCIPLHPYLVGQPYRTAAFEDALSYITGHDKVWKATGREIASYFNEHYFDVFVDAAHRGGVAP